MHPLTFSLTSTHPILCTDVPGVVLYHCLLAATLYPFPTNTQILYALVRRHPAPQAPTFLLVHIQTLHLDPTGQPPFYGKTDRRCAGHEYLIRRLPFLVRLRPVLPRRSNAGTRLIRRRDIIVVIVRCRGQGDSSVVEAFAGVVSVRSQRYCASAERGGGGREKEDGE
jgi:hypothetical protein